MLGRLSQPWDPIIPIGASLLITPSFLLLMISVHYAASQPAKIWSHAHFVRDCHASLVSLVYVTWLFVVEPHVLNGTRVKVELLVFKPGSFMQMVDGSAIPSWVSPHCSRRRASMGHRRQRPAALLVLSAYVFYRWLSGFLPRCCSLTYGVVLALYVRTPSVRGQGRTMRPKAKVGRRSLSATSGPDVGLPCPEEHSRFGE